MLNHVNQNNSMKVLDADMLVDKYLESFASFQEYNTFNRDVPAEMLSKYMAIDYSKMRPLLEYMQEWLIDCIDVHRCTYDTRIEHICKLQDIIDKFPTRIYSPYHFKQEQYYKEICSTLLYFRKAWDYLNAEYFDLNRKGIRIPL